MENMKKTFAQTTEQMKKEEKNGTAYARYSKSGLYSGTDSNIESHIKNA